jgi:hypothetical protein
MNLERAQEGCRRRACSRHREGMPGQVLDLAKSRHPSETAVQCSFNFMEMTGYGFRRYGRKKRKSTSYDFINLEFLRFHLI